jgi:potassium-transporting ATPase potassium-binding subunit
MTANGLLQIGLYLGVLLLLVKPLGLHMARVYEGRPPLLGRLLGPVERGIYRLCGVDPASEMSWPHYTGAVLLFSGVGFALLYALQRLQAGLPLNPDGMGAVPPELAFNTTISFVTNTNWQAYGGESTMSPLTQMAGLAVQQFLSAAMGMAVLVALIRGFVRQSSKTIGNFWADLVRGVLYILLPLSLLLAVVLVSQGVVQTLGGHATVALLEPTRDDRGNPVTEQAVARGPVASMIAIKQLGTNGGGFTNVNSAHPFENPTPLSNFLELLSILLIAAALCYTFGGMVGDTRQGWTLLAAMVVMFCGALALCLCAEQRGTPVLTALGVDAAPGDAQAGGTMEGKEVRFGIVNSALWATATTAASNGSVNAMHDSFTPLGGLVPMVLIQLGEVVFGGVGSGLYGMLVFAIVTVFLAGLMVGRTPEYLGKKIEAFEMKMASLVLLVPVLLVLIGTAVAVALPSTVASLANRGPHGFSEVLYAFSSMGNNNGSAFAGLNASTPFFTIAGGLAMFFGRYWTMIPVLAIAGSLARKKRVPASAGTLPTHGALFAAMLIAVVLLLGALSFLPALALGPIVEHLMMGS